MYILWLLLWGRRRAACVGLKAVSSWDGEQKNLLELRLGPISGRGAGRAKARAGDKCRHKGE